MNPCANAPLRISVRLAMTLPTAGTPASPPRSWESLLFKHSRPPGRRPLFGTLCATSRQQQPYNLEGEQVMGLFAKLTSHYVEKDTSCNSCRRQTSRWSCTRLPMSLTQLPNRRALFKQLALRFASARAQQQQVSLYFYRSRWFQSH